MTNGLKIHTGYLELEEQRQLLAEIDRGLAEAPLYTAVMPKTGKPLSVQMSNFGSLGWVSDRSGYRYQPLHPETGRPWPAIPEAILAIWRKLADYPHEPEACLVNYYRESARMGLHRDADEEDFAAPVVSISLGDKALFRIGGLSRSDPTRSITLSSGDVVVMGGASRLCYHGIDRILPGTSRLISEGGRINLTLRRVPRP
jgi:alkylated DNA repair protein (DNA oxidative demethylase)